MTHVTGRLTAKNRDQLWNATLGNRVWATFTFYLTHTCTWLIVGKLLTSVSIQGMMCCQEIAVLWLWDEDLGLESIWGQFVVLVIILLGLSNKTWNGVLAGKIPFKLTFQEIHTHTYTHSCLTVVCLGLLGWSGTRRNNHPVTPVLIIRHPLSTSSIYYHI